MTIKKYDIIMADPPWTHSNRPCNSTAADTHYLLMSLEEIKNLPIISQIRSDNCLLFLWGTAPLLPEALEVISSWGFSYLTCAVWDKMHKCGIGYWFRNSHELLLVGRRGKMRPPSTGLRVSSIFKEKKGKHSRKPTIVRNWIDRAFPDCSKIELFAREVGLFRGKKFPNWDSWGNEV